MYPYQPKTMFLLSLWLVYVNILLNIIFYLLVYILDEILFLIPSVSCTLSLFGALGFAYKMRKHCIDEYKITPVSL